MTEEMSRAKVNCANCGVEIYYSESSTRWTEENGTGRNVCPAGKSSIARHIPETNQDREDLIDFVDGILKDSDRFGALTCGTTKAAAGWACSRELGHEDSCAASRLPAEPKDEGANRVEKLAAATILNNWVNRAQAEYAIRCELVYLLRDLVDARTEGERDIVMARIKNQSDVKYRKMPALLSPRAEAAPEAAGPQECGHTWNCMVCDKCPECEGCEHVDKKVWPEPATEGAPETTDEEDENLTDEVCPNCGEVGVGYGAFCHNTGLPWPETKAEGAEKDQPETGKDSLQFVGEKSMKRPKARAAISFMRYTEVINADEADAYMDALESRNAELEKLLDDLNDRYSSAKDEWLEDLSTANVCLGTPRKDRNRENWQNVRAEKAEREVERLTQQSANVSFNEGVDAAIAFVVGGRFLSDEAPTAQFAREVAENLPRIKRVESSPSAQKEGE